MLKVERQLVNLGDFLRTHSGQLRGLLFFFVVTKLYLSTNIVFLIGAKLWDKQRGTTWNLFRRYSSQIPVQVIFLFSDFPGMSEGMIGSTLAYLEKRIGCRSG